MTEAQVKNAVEKFEALIRAQSDRSDKIKAQGDFIDFKSLDKIIIGVCGGDGIGPATASVRSSPRNPQEFSNICLTIK